MAADGSRATERWQILKRAILAAGGKSAGEHTTSRQPQAQRTDVSVRSFSTFELFTVTDMEGDREEREKAGCKGAGTQDERKGLWKRYMYQNRTDSAESESQRSEISASIRFLPPTTCLEAMMGFNNTGNVCMWPSEEVLAYYCLRNVYQFSGKSVCELGGGMTCLAGIMLALSGAPARVRLTDGNATSIKNVRQIKEANRNAFGKVCVSEDVLLWNEDFLNSDYPKFDFIICADCLFFVELHKCLSRVIQKLLRPGGKALLFNPRRSGSLDQFVEVARRLFVVSEVERYDEVVWDKHCLAMSGSKLYRPDLHYPVLLVLESAQDETI